jgi:CRP/FNR family cyclic AMP-dependent transcriptional regulator
LDSLENLAVAVKIENTTLLQSGWLSRIPPEIATAIIDAGRPKHFSNGDTIYGFDQPQDCLYGIAKGIVRMWIMMNEQEPRFGHIAGPGFWFGENELVTGKHRTMEMIACGESLLHMVDRSTVDRLAKHNTGIWPAVALLAVMNQGTAIGAADDLLIRDSKKRLAAVLLRLCQRRNAFQGVTHLDRIPITHNELAEASCLSRSATAALLSNLSASGLISTEYGSISILNAEGLAAIMVG